MAEPSTQDWRRRMAELARGAGKPHAPLWLPMLFSGASQIEALPVADFVSDATKLGKGLSELRRIVGIAGIVTAVPSAMEAEALGATVDLSVWPPVITASPGAAVAGIGDFSERFKQCERLQASLSATRRLAESESGNPVLMAVLTGPAQLVQQLAPEATDTEREALFDLAGRVLAGIVGEYAKAGIHAIVLREIVVDVAMRDMWQGALGPIGNVARFHKVPPILQFDNTPAEADDWPRNLIPCRNDTLSAALSGPAHATVLPADPLLWKALPDGANNARLVTTDGEVSVTISVATLREQCALLAG